MILLPCPAELSPPAMPERENYAVTSLISRSRHLPLIAFVLREWKQPLSGRLRDISVSGFFLLAKLAFFCGVAVATLHSHLFALAIPALLIFFQALNQTFGRSFETGHPVRRISLFAPENGPMLEQVYVAGVRFRTLAALRMGDWGILAWPAIRFYRWYLPALSGALSFLYWYLLLSGRVPMVDDICYSVVGAFSVGLILHYVALPLRIYLPCTLAIRTMLRGVRYRARHGMALDNLQILFLVYSMATVVGVWIGLMVYVAAWMFGPAVFPLGVSLLAFLVFWNRHNIDTQIPAALHAYWRRAIAEGEEALRELVGERSEGSAGALPAGALHRQVSGDLGATAAATGRLLGATAPKT